MARRWFDGIQPDSEQNVALPPTSLVQLRESMAVGSCCMLSCLSRTSPLSESGTKDTSVIDVDEVSLGCDKKHRKTSGCLGSADAFYTLSLLWFVKKTRRKQQFKVILRKKEGGAASCIHWAEPALQKWRHYAREIWGAQA